MSASGRMMESLPTTIRGRLDQARCLKQEGNELFRAKEWRRAVKKYHHALMYCKGITDKLDFIPGMAAAGGIKPTQEEEKEATELSMAVTNNLAACLTHMEEWDRVIMHTSTVLKIQSDNAKAFYRRGVARLRLGLLDGAEEDLMSANQIDPNDKDVKQRLQEVFTKRKEYESKEKEMYTAMFTTT